MNFSTFKYNGAELCGIAKADGYYSFNDLIEKDPPKTLLDFIRQHENSTLPDFDAIITAKNIAPIPKEKVTLLAPIPNPARDIICIGRNYEEHSKEVVETMEKDKTQKIVPDWGVYFAKAAYPPAAHNQELPTHEAFTKKLDYEGELAVIMGKTARNVAKENVKDYIFGYSVANDITARDKQMNHSQWFFGKSFDNACPIGPHIVHVNSIPYPPKLDITCHVNGELRQSSNTLHFIFDIDHIVSELSHGMTLAPGTIILTGTSKGVGHAMKPPVYIKKGDKIDVYIEHIGTLTNTFV